jgi:flagellin-like hook-associated protein FlgL
MTSMALSLLSSSYSGYVTDLQTQIDAVQAKLTTGKNVLTPSDTATVTQLSAKSTAVASAETSITKAKSVIDVAITGLKSISTVMGQLNTLAMNAKSPGLSNNDLDSFNTRFQNLLLEVQKLASSASVNGSNLLTGTASLFVTTGVDGTPSSKTTIGNVNVFGLVTMGEMSGMKVDTTDHAAKAMDAISHAMSYLASRQSQLQFTSQTLTKQGAAVTNLGTQTQNQISAIQNVNVPQLQAQLQALQNMQKIDYDFLSQIDPTAASVLTISS